MAYQLAMELLQSCVTSPDGTLSPSVVSSVERIIHHSSSLIAFAKVPSFPWPICGLRKD